MSPTNYQQEGCVVQTPQNAAISDVCGGGPDWHERFRYYLANKKFKIDFRPRLLECTTANLEIEGLLAIDYCLIDSRHVY